MVMSPCQIGFFFSSELVCSFTFIFTILYSENIILFKTYFHLRNGIYFYLLLEKNLA